MPDSRTVGLAEALESALRLGQLVLGAQGMAIAEIDDDTHGRVISSVGVSHWSIGRRLPQPGWTDNALIQVVRVDDWPAALLGAFGIAAHEDQSYGIHESLIEHLTGVVSEICRTYMTPPREKSDRELFIAVTSHELRTPVTVIKGYADTLRDHWDQLDDQARRDAARVIGQRTDDLARMVDRLLASSVPTGMQTTRTPFDLLETLRQAAASLPSDLRRRLSLSLPTQLPPAFGDRSTISNVLTELVTNAHKYSPGPEPVVLSASSGSDTVHFRVTDRGIGIPSDRLQRVFERFWQADTGDNRRYGGAGLGLFLVRKTIERQNGWVFLHPRDGGGTVAEVHLPRGDVGASGEA